MNGKDIDEIVNQASQEQDFITDLAQDTVRWFLDESRIGNAYPLEYATEELAGDLGVSYSEASRTISSVVSTTSTGATVEVELMEYKFYDDPADIHARFSAVDYDSVDTTVIETPHISVPSESTLDKIKGLFTISGSSDDSNIVKTISTDSLEPDTEYNMIVVGKVPHETGVDVEYSDSITFTTDSA